MTRTEFLNVGKKTDAELAGYSVYETAAIEAHVRQVNEEQARSAAAKAEHTKELAAAQAKAREAVKAAEDQAEALRKDLGQKVKELHSQLTVAVAERDAAVARLESHETSAEFKAKKLAEAKALKEKAEKVIAEFGK